MIRSFLASLLISASATAAFAQDSLKVQAVTQAPPSSISPEISKDLDGQHASLIQDEKGGDFARIWLRKATPGSEKPGEPKGVIQFPFLKDGELIGVLEFAKEGHDYRDQAVAKGVYTMRYGLQPVNGDHLGVSEYRDYILLLPTSKDKTVAAPARKQLEERSADAAGTSHPASFLLLDGAGGDQARAGDGPRQREGYLERDPAPQAPGQGERRAVGVSGPARGRWGRGGLSSLTDRDEPRAVDRPMDPPAPGRRPG